MITSMMMKKMMAVVVGTLVVATLAAPAVAQTGPGPQGPGPGPGPGPAASDQARQRGERMRAIRGKVLRQRVGLDEAKAVKVEAVLDQLEPEKHKARESVREARQQLRRLFRSKSDDQKAYQQALDRLQASHKTLQQVRERQLDALKRELTPKEQAKLLVELGRIGRRMNQLGPAGRRGEPGRGGPGRGGRGGPGRGGRGGPGADRGREGPGGPWGPPAAEDPEAP